VDLTHRLSFVDLSRLLAGAIDVFVPIFVAMDPIGALPFVVAWTANLPRAERLRQLRAALLTALIIGLGFLIAGRWLLGVLGVDVPDFLIAGGLILLALAVSDLVVGGGHEARGSTIRPDFGVVPIGTPLLVGPASLTTLIVLVDRDGLIATALAFVANLIIAWAVFRGAGTLTERFGRNGLRAVSKVVSLLLAAIAVAYIREGLAAILTPTVGR
jgi:multiple antibiotic resistance protein